MAKKRAEKEAKKKYRVSGTQPLWIEGQQFKEGDEFEALLTPEYETQMLMGGHLELLSDTSAAQDRDLARGVTEPPDDSSVE